MVSARCVGLLIACLAFEACAFVDRRVNLRPPPAATFDARARSTSPGLSVVVARPQDLRDDATSIGNVRNGYGMVTAHVRSSDDAVLWVSSALIEGLQRGGVSVQRVDRIDGASPGIGLEIAVRKVFVDDCIGFFTAGPCANIAAEIEVYRHGARVARRAYGGTADERSFFGTSAASEYEHALHSALADLLRQAVPDLTAVLSALETQARQ